MQPEKKKFNTKVLWPILIVVLLIVGYFVYAAFFDTSDAGLTTGSNKYISQTKVGRYVDILNKENLSFSSNINNNFLLKAKDFSIPIAPSNGIGRRNPFLP